MRLERQHILSRRPPPSNPAWVVYWMQASVRFSDNLALELAAREASTRNLPLIVVFGLTNRYPGASIRHYNFLLDGLKLVAKNLRDHGIPFVVRNLPPHEAALELAEYAALTVTDMGYTRIQRYWRDEFVFKTPGPAVMVEDNVCVPVETAYGKSAVGARVLRPRINQVRDEFLSDGIGLVETAGVMSDFDWNIETGAGLDSGDLDIAPEPAVVPGARGGSEEADRTLTRFLSDVLPRYAEHKNDPTKKATSGLSAFIHFGQISVREIARKVLAVGGDGSEEFLEELLVRRELAINYAWYNKDYDSPDTLPVWARENLDAHASDSRPIVYGEPELLAGETHDPYWNACQLEMIHTGSMHGYMRMYWGKKVIEWTSDWRQAWHLLLKWNDTYELDGRDPNGYAGVAWCFGMHDRPWAQRPVFGAIRYMNDAGLKRKFDIDAYVDDVKRRIGEVS